MDDARIRQLTEEVLGQLRQAQPDRTGIEARVAALESAVRELQAGHPPAPAGATAVARVELRTHPSHGRFELPDAGDGRCVLEPDRPCVGSGQCRTLGH